MSLSHQITGSIFVGITCSIAYLCCTGSKDNGTDKETDITTDTVDAGDSDDTDSQELPEPFDTDAIAAKLDTFWGNSPDQRDRLLAFDWMWDNIAEDYPGFVISDVDWNEIRDRYRPAIAKADTYGRFYSIFTQIYNKLHDGHTVITSYKVCGSDAHPLDPSPNLGLSRRPPLFVIENRISYIDACVTALEDDTLLVYKVAPDNPAGLEPGDFILGYDKRPWRELLSIIYDMELPSCGRSATNVEALDIQRMESVVNNSHLFEEMNVLKADTGKVISVSTEQLIGKNSDFLCNSQLPLAEVDFPCTHWGICYDEFPSLEGVIKWTILPSKIGYIYVYGWTGKNTSDEFRQAIEHMMDTTIGIVIDQRFGVGGGATWNEGLKLLFDQTHTDIIHNWVRAEFTEDNYKEMEYGRRGEEYDIIGDPETYYDNPIAVLTGPQMGSAGDIFPLVMVYHPKTRRFGRLTDGRVGQIVSIDGLINPYCKDMISTMTKSLMSDAEGNILQGTPLYPEERVWLDPDDVIAGIDTVRQAAFDWIILSQ